MILDYLRTDGHEIHWDLIQLGARSNANTFVVPMQDLLGLGSEARMNTPGVAGGNWQWRFSCSNARRRPCSRPSTKRPNTKRPSPKSFDGRD